MWQAFLWLRWGWQSSGFVLSDAAVAFDALGLDRDEWSDALDLLFRLYREECGGSDANLAGSD